MRGGVFTTVCLKDSRELNEADLKKIVAAVEESPHAKIIITHGTYTMPDTARYLEANLTRHDQTIVITGSMIPIAGFSPSDGPFSIGYALSKVMELSSGIYVAMNGRTFRPDEVTKIISEGRFISILGEK